MYKLVNKSTGEIATYSSEPIAFGGPWGASDVDGNPLYEWVDLSSDEKYLLEQEKRIKKSLILSELSSLDYKCLKFVDGEITAEEYEPIKGRRMSLRGLYNLVDAAETLADLEAILL
ncbi:hypothetical protein [Anaeromusa sp.]|uniref:hypothetical protein n=1 Tax=Anaeromusa sp. TaxID=1872520 RepID=UPI00263269EF|nr:hypothetical protein [Anaeromusa sp.]MDD3157028.1 hypothetical protein [Anaeromusa sp.]